MWVRLRPPVLLLLVLQLLLVALLAPRAAAQASLDFNVKTGASVKNMRVGALRGTGFVVARSHTPEVEKGDQLVAVNGVMLSRLTLQQALQQAAGSEAVMLPLVAMREDGDEGGGADGEALGAFVKLQIVAPETMRFRPRTEARKKVVRAKLESARAKKAQREQKLREMEERKKRLQEAEAARAKAAEAARTMAAEVEKQKSQSIADAKRQALAEAKKQAAQAAAARAEAEQTGDGGGGAQAPTAAGGAAGGGAGAPAAGQPGAPPGQGQGAAAAAAAPPPDGAGAGAAAAAPGATPEAQAAQVAEQEKRKLQWEERKAKAMKQAKELENRRAKADGDRKKRVEEQSQRKAELEKDAKAKRAVADLARRKALGEAYEYTVTFKEAGIMGLQFDANSLNSAPVSHIEDGSAATLLEETLQLKDELIGVNGVPTAKLSAKNAMLVLGSAEWPRQLTFRRPEGGHAKLRKEEDAKTALKERLWTTKLVVTSPVILAGHYNISYAEWGPPLSSSCASREIKMGVVDSEGFAFACEHDKTKTPAADPSSAAIHLVWRGHCTFVDKAHITSRNGGGAALVVNTEEKPLGELPAGNQLTADVKVGAAMMLKSAGEQLAEFLTRGVKLAGFFAIGGRCETQEAAIEKAVGSAAIFRGLAAKRGKKGEIIFWDAYSKSILVRAEYQAAFFGNRLSTLPRRVVWADPPDGCQSEKISPSAAGAIVLVVRGGCSFGIKVKAVMNRRAKAVVVVNNAGPAFPMQCEPNERKILKIQVRPSMGHQRAREARTHTTTTNTPPAHAHACAPAPPRPPGWRAAPLGQASTMHSNAGSKVKYAIDNGADLWARFL
jgi:hypothetical protein